MKVLYKNPSPIISGNWLLVNAALCIFNKILLLISNITQDMHNLSLTFSLRLYLHVHAHTFSLHLICIDAQP